MNHPLVDKDLKVKLQLLNKEILLDKDTKQYLHVFSNTAQNRFEKYLEAIYYTFKNNKLVLSVVINNQDVTKMSKKELKNSLKKILYQIDEEIQSQLQSSINPKIKVKLIDEPIKQTNQIYKKEK